MSRFAGSLIIRAFTRDEVVAAKSDSQLYELQQALIYHSDLLGTITAPVGLVTNFASIPRPVWSWMDPEDPVILYPSVIHDYLYGCQGKLPGGQVVTRQEADALLREAMGICGASWTQRNTVYAALRVGGGHAWDNPNPL